MHLYERIFEELRRSIAEGERGPGERLPSIREIAALHGCNKITAQKAFDLLGAAGLAENRVGSGSYVTFPGPPEERAGDFSSALLSEEFFPYEAAGSLFAELLARERGKVFSIAPARGEPRLLAALARRFSIPEQRLIITGGGRQGLDLARRHFSEKTELSVLVEEPTYPGALSLFRPKEALPFGLDGPDPEAFARVFADRRGTEPAVFYSVPELHNPTGRSCSVERKRAIAEAARRYDVFIIEDDYLSELLPSASPRFVDLIPERTIWIKSLSKTTAPGIRIGLLAVPQILVDRFVRLAAESYPGPSSWLQLFAEGLVSSGLYERCLASTSSIIERRRAELSALIGRFPVLSCDGATERGYNLWVRASKPSRLVSPPWAEGFRFGRSPETRASFRLSFMAIGETEWQTALLRLEGALGAAYGA